MCVSERLCKDHIDLLMELLRCHGVDYVVKANIIITIGDLFNRFPNVLNEKTKDVFMLLHDRQVHVRRQALMVISHLILNDMLKLKGEIVDICMLLEDPNQRIRDQVKLFLHELDKKGSNNIYNLFPKAISRLSKEFGALTLAEFQNIANNLLGFINKEKQTEAIVDKLCHKFRTSENPVEWRNTAYCLSKLQYKEKSFLRLLEHYDDFKDQLLAHAEVREFFLELGRTLHKQLFNRPELRKFLDEYDQKIGATDENEQLQLRQTQLV